MSFSSLFCEPLYDGGRPASQLSFANLFSDPLNGGN